MDNSAPLGVELRLTGVPSRMSAGALKYALAEYHLKNMKYDFLVILEKSSEELFWESFDSLEDDRTITARVIIPHNFCGFNSGRALMDRNILIRYRKSEYEVHVAEISNPETTNLKYEELRHMKRVLYPIGALQNGLIGLVRKVSCGSFDEDNKFETTHTWSCRQGQRFREFNYFGDVWPKKFQVCLAEAEQGEPLKLEWMDLHASNIRGLIFEHPKQQNLDHRVVYFVVDKPPQFYQRTEKAPSSANEIGIQLVHSRISHPSLTLQLEYSDLDICGTPWIIQYSRVFKVEYEMAQDLNLSSYRPQINQEQKGNLVSFDHPGIEDSDRALADMSATLQSNLEDMSNIRLRYHLECQLAVVKLLYNCNVSATSAEATSVIDRLMALDKYFTSRPRHVGVKLNKFAQDTGTSQDRALQHFHAALPEDLPKLPEKPMRKLLKPIEAFDKIFSWSWDHVNLCGLMDDSPVAFEISVYPSHIELQGPIDLNSNSITGQFRRRVDHFIRVRFVDNNRKPLKVEDGINLDSIIEHRVFRVLTNERQLLPIRARLEYVGYSVSSLKKKKAVWFVFHQNFDLIAEEIRNTVGKWDYKDDTIRSLAKNPSKWGARIALAFTESIPVVELSRHEWDCREDCGRNEKFPNTDGCGVIHPELCDTINAALVPLGFARSQAFQIRFGGAKGVVYSGARSLLINKDSQFKMLLRSSQLKFPVPDSSKLTLRVVSTAGDGHSSLFFPSLLKALEDSDADTTEIENVYDTIYGHLTNRSTESLNLLHQIFRVPDDERQTGIKTRYALLQLAIRLQRDGIHPEYDKNSFLSLYIAKLAERARDKDLFKIPIPGSYSALGLTDDYQILGLDEVFIRARGQTISGPVLLYRDPIIHIGDIQEAVALNEEDIKTRMAEYEDIDDRFNGLVSMDNVIFFSQEDNPPLPNRLSGGDLDGDRFEILTKECSFWKEAYKTSVPDNYTDDDPALPVKKAPDMESFEHIEWAKSFNVEELAKSIGEYLWNDCFGDLQDIQMCLADRKPEGMKNQDVKDLAKVLSTAVDFAKSGTGVALTEISQKPEFKVVVKPDFLRALNLKAFYDPKGDYTPSPNLLGKIYRNIASKEYDVPQEIDDSDLQERVTAAWEQKMRKDPDLIGYIGKFDVAMADVATKMLESYVEYVEKQYLAESSEVDLFLRKKQDDYPDGFIYDQLHFDYLNMALCL